MNSLDEIKLATEPDCVVTTREYHFEIKKGRYNSIKSSVSFVNGVLSNIRYDSQNLTEDEVWKVNEVIVEKLKELKETEKRNTLK